MNRHLKDTWIQLLIKISHDIDTRVSNGGKHSCRVAEWVTCTARELGCSEEKIADLYWAAMLHDIGKVGVPDQVLRKAGPLNDQEWSLMRLHPTVGANLVKSSQTVAHLAPAIYAHQEKFDGSGYPEGLRGEEIPLEARILAVVDAFDAMTTDRCYRKARTHHEAVEELRQKGGSHFDNRVVEAFLKALPATGELSQ